jgi:SAM-dependent methyltransferase
VLDAGGGDGSYAIEACLRGARTVAIDTDERMVAAARRRASARGVCIHVARANVEAMPFPDASFDLVLAVTVLCFVRDPGAALRQIGRVLAPRGRLVIGELGRWSVWAAERRMRGWRGHPTWRDVRFWSRRDLRRLVGSAGLSVDVVRGAVHNPSSALAARMLSRFDRALGRLRAPGAAFLAVAAHKAEESR